MDDLYTLGLITISLIVISHFFEPRRRGHDTPRDRPIYFPNIVGLLFACFFYLIAWGALLYPILFFVITALDKSYSLSFNPIACLEVIFWCLLALLPINHFVRCKHCHKRLLVQEFETPDYVEPVMGMKGWSSIVIRVITRRPFRCMYCGQKYHPL